jgi:hypothetical protein
MSFLKRLFRGSSQPTPPAPPAQQTSPPPEQQAAPHPVSSKPNEQPSPIMPLTDKGPDKDGHVRDGKVAYWYAAEDLPKRLTQVVVTFPPKSATRSKFGGFVLDNIMPTYESHRLLKSQPWIVHFFHFDTDWGPHPLVRADKVAAEFIACPIKCAFGFCQLPTSGLFAMHVQVDCPKLHPYLSYPQVTFELVLGLDTTYARENIEKLLNMNEARFTFTDGYASAQRALQYDVCAAVQPAAQDALVSQWKRLLAHHDRIPQSSRSFEAAVSLFRAQHPESEDPVLPFLAAAKLLGRSEITNDG